MALNTSPEKRNWSHVHYVYVEKSGPFMQSAPAAWQEFNQLRPQLEALKPVAFTSAYKMEPKPVYRAGCFVAEKPKDLPKGLAYSYFEGGEYTYFTLTGSYSQLPVACGQVMGIFAKSKAKRRDAFYLENYVNDPRTTPEAELITEIMIPTVS